MTREEVEEMVDEAVEEGEDDDGGISGEMSAELTFATMYVWRGQALNEEPVLQPSVTASSMGFSFNTWANLDITDGTNDTPLVGGQFSEVDLTLSYGQELGPVGVEVGHIEYLFPAGGLGTRELFLALAVDLLVSPSLLLAWDYDEGEGLYGNLAVSYGLGLLDWLGLSTSVSLGFATEGLAFGAEDAALQDLAIALGFDFSVIGPFTIGLGAAFSIFIDSDVADAAGDADNSFWGWLTLGYAP